MIESGTRVFANVCDTIEVDPEQAAGLRLRSGLLFAVRTSIDGWRTTRETIEARLGLGSSRLDDILQGRIDALSLDDLVAIANRAGVTIRVEAVAVVARARHRPALTRRGAGLTIGTV